MTAPVTIQMWRRGGFEQVTEPDSTRSFPNERCAADFMDSAEAAQWRTFRFESVDQRIRVDSLRN